MRFSSPSPWLSVATRGSSTRARCTIRRSADGRVAPEAPPRRRRPPCARPPASARKLSSRALRRPAPSTRQCTSLPGQAADRARQQMIQVVQQPRRARGDAPRPCRCQRITRRSGLTLDLRAEMRSASRQQPADRDKSREPRLLVRREEMLRTACRGRGTSARDGRLSRDAATCDGVAGALGDRCVRSPVAMPPGTGVAGSAARRRSSVERAAAASPDRPRRSQSGADSCHETVAAWRRSDRRSPPATDREACRGHQRLRQGGAGEESPVFMSVIALRPPAFFDAARPPRSARWSLIEL